MSRITAEQINNLTRETLDRHTPLVNAVDSILSGITKIRNNPYYIDYEEIEMIIQTLDTLGFFELRNSTIKTAKALSISKVTVYNYMKKKI